MLPDSILALCKNQPNFNDLRDLIKRAHKLAKSFAYNDAAALLSEYLVHRIETKYLSIPVETTTQDFVDFLRKNYERCSIKEAQRIVIFLSSVPLEEPIQDVLCMVYFFPDRLLNSMDFQEETARSIAALNAQPIQDEMNKSCKLAFRTPVAESLN